VQIQFFSEAASRTVPNYNREIRTEGHSAKIAEIQPRTPNSEPPTTPGEEQNGEVPLPQRVLCRIRYFTEGITLGSQGFVESHFGRLRGRFGYFASPFDLSANSTNSTVVRETHLSLPEIAFTASTRVMLGAGIALLLADRLNPEQRKAVGATLALVGLLTTIPIVWAVFCRGE